MNQSSPPELLMIPDPKVDRPCRSILLLKNPQTYTLPAASNATEVAMLSPFPLGVKPHI
jgi:hypothetical protein